MKLYQQHEKDISKVFTFVRVQLQTKEKQLLELQRTNPCLVAPDSEQVDILVGAIGALQLSTPDESFVFASASDDDDRETTRRTSICSDGFNSIKTLPSSVWLSQSSTVKRRSSTFGHLLSLPMDAYLTSPRSSTFETPTQVNHIASHLLDMPLSAFKPVSSLPSSRPSTFETPNQVNHMANHLPDMPLSAFKPSSTIRTSIETKNEQNNSLPTTEGTRKSLVDAGMMFSKELWLQNDTSSKPRTNSLMDTGSIYSKEMWLQNN